MCKLNERDGALDLNSLAAYMSMEETVQQYWKICRLVLIERTSPSNEPMRSRFEHMLSILLFVVEYNT